MSQSNFKYNRQSFNVEAKEKPLLELYTKLVILELFLKEKYSDFKSHEMLKDKLKEFLGSVSPLGELDLIKDKLWVDNHGVAKLIKNAGKGGYPHLRYLRHCNDNPNNSEASSDDDIRECLDEVKKIYKQLGTQIYE